MASIGSVGFKNKNITELPYVNDEFQYDIKTSPWQMIRPSYLIFLNNTLPVVHSPWKIGDKKMLQVAEVGVAGGMNAHMMLKASNDTFIHLIDNWNRGQSSESVRKLCEPFKDRTKIMEMDSVEASKQYPDHFFDYVYIDAGHDYDSASKDIEAWYPKVKIGGMMAGHDWFLLSVRKAIVNYLEKNNLPQRLWAVSNFFDPRLATEEMNAEEGQFSDWWFVKLNIDKG